MPRKGKRARDPLLYGDFYIKHFPRRLKAGFHAYCLLRGITMREKLIYLIRKAINEGRDESGGST